MVQEQPDMRAEKAAGKKLSKFMNQKGVNELWLKEHTGINYRYISSVLEGTCSPTISVYKKLADALNVPLWKLFKEDGKKKKE